MAEQSFYHHASRQLQDKFDSRRIADRLEQVQVHACFTDEDRGFISRCAMFFLATADAEGRPDCSYKGGMPGFVRVIDEHTLAFPDYNGNGMFRSLGNLLLNPHVGLLFIDLANPERLRVNGLATVHENDPLLSEYAGALAIVRVRATHIFPNCPRYIHRMKLINHSVYVPREGHTPPVPGWKRWDEFRSLLPKSDGEVKPSLSTFLRRMETKNQFLKWCVLGLKRVRNVQLPSAGACRSRTR